MSPQPFPYFPSPTARYEVPLADTLPAGRALADAVAAAVGWRRVVADPRACLDAHAAAVRAGAPWRPAPPAAHHDRCQHTEDGVRRGAM